MAGPLDLTFPPDGDPGGDAADATANAAIGAVADAANTTGATGSISGKLRGLITILADIWNSTSHFFKVSDVTLKYGEDFTNNTQGVTQKPVASATYSPTNYKDAGSVTKANIKASAGAVFSLRVTNANAAARYFQLHNKATAPAATENAQMYFLIPAGTAAAPGVLVLDSDWFALEEFFATGIGWAVSTTAAAFTDSATAGEHTVDVRYV